MPVDFLFPMFLSYPPSNCPWSNVQLEEAVHLRFSGEPTRAGGESFDWHCERKACDHQLVQVTHGLREAQDGIGWRCSQNGRNSLQ